MEKALTTINLLPSGKKQVDAFTWKLKKEILAATKDPLPILVQLKYIERTIADILKDEEIEDYFLKEFQLYEREKQIEVNGAVIRQSEVGVKYDYEASGDPVWNDLNKQINELTELKKKQEKLLQSLDENGLVDPDTGLFITRPPKSSKTKVVVTIK